MATTTQPGLSTDMALGLREMFVQNLEREHETTSRVLAAVPSDPAKNSYKPDPKAKSGWELAWHIASSDVWFVQALADMKFEGDESALNNELAKLKSTDDLVRWYKENFAKHLGRVKQMSGEQLTSILDFMGAFQLPAVFYLGFTLNHMIHHRGQLSTYLRPMGSKVPSIYGPSADDENWK